MAIFPPPGMPPQMGPQGPPMGPPPADMQQGFPDLSMMQPQLDPQMMQMLMQQAQQMQDQQTDQHFRQVAKSEWAPLVRQVQDRRRTIEESWMANLDCWNTKHRRQGFRGEMFNHYLPSGRSAIEKFVSRCRKLLFPSPEFFEVYPIEDQLNDLGPIAESWRTFLLWRMNEIRARGIVEQLIRCRLLYQRCIAKTGLRRETDGQLWPYFRAVDPFTFYTFPETATCIEEASLVFEHSMVSWNDYAAWVSKGLADQIDRSKLTKPEWPWHYVMRLSSSGLTPPTDAPAIGGSGQGNIAGSEPVQFLSFTDMWFREDDRWVNVWLVWNLPNAPVAVRANWKFPANPYRMSCARLLPGQQYTNSSMSDVEALNVVLNDQYNMMLEGQAIANFPPTIVDPDLVARQDSLVYGPRRKWFGNVEGFKVLDNSSSRNAQLASAQNLAGTLGMIDSYAGGSGMTQGTPAKGLPRAGYAASQLIDLSMADIQDMAESIEDDILTLVLKDMAQLTLELVPPEQMVMVPGAERASAARFNVQYLQQGQYAFRWVGSLQSNNAQTRAQRMMVLTGQLAKLYPMMQQEGWALDFGTFVKKLWRDSLGERGADTILVRNPMGPPPQPGAASGGPPGQGGGQPQAPAATPEQSYRQDARQTAESSSSVYAPGMPGE